MSEPTDLRALKTFYGQLVKEVGGVYAAEAVLGYAPGNISKAGSVNHLEVWPRVDHIAQLEAVSGKPHVTAHLARLAGCTLLPIPRADGDQGAALAAVLRSAGELGSRTALALADGMLSDAEKATLSEELDVLARAVAHARSLLSPQAPRALVVNR